jgi:hypothetical protein
MQKTLRRFERTLDMVFLCLARDCEETIPAFFSFVRDLESAGIRCALLIGEDGSRDRTRALLEGAHGLDLDVLDTAFMSAAPTRLARMAVGRQALLERARAKMPSHRFVCVADLDDVMMEPPSVRSIEEALRTLLLNDQVFAIGAGSQPYYYDLLSLKDEDCEFASLFRDLQDAKRRPLAYYRFHRERIYKEQGVASRRVGTTCISSFNGLCIYNASDYYLGSYRANNEAMICEHVSLNSQIARVTGRRLLISK